MPSNSLGSVPFFEGVCYIFITLAAGAACFCVGVVGVAFVGVAFVGGDFGVAFAVVVGACVGLGSSDNAVPTKAKTRIRRIVFIASSMSNF